MDEGHIRAAIEACAPELHIGAVTLEGEGDFCRAYRVNGEVIFRFAYNEEGSRALEREAALLPRLAPTLSLPIPYIRWAGRQPDSGWSFVGYARLGGEPLRRVHMAQMGEGERRSFARALGRFLKELHSFDCEEARAAGVPSCHYPFGRSEQGINTLPAAQVYRAEEERLSAHPVLRHFLGESGAIAVRASTRDLLLHLLTEPGRGELAPCLVHGDLSGEHILYDGERRSIEGVIDFSDMVITTPLLDFTYLKGEYGGDFLALLLEAYGLPDPGPLLARVGLMSRWLTAMRLLWALDHEHASAARKQAEQLLNM